VRDLDWSPSATVSIVIVSECPIWNTGLTEIGVNAGVGHAFMNRYTDFVKEKRKGAPAALEPCVCEDVMASSRTPL